MLTGSLGPLGGLPAFRPRRTPSRRCAPGGLRLLPVGLLLALSACAGPHTAAPPEAALEAALRRLLARHPEATVAVAVRDPHTGTTLDLLPDRSFHAASTMKVAVMLEVFRQAEAGRFSLADSLLVRNSFRSIVDGSPYRIEDDADDALYAHLGRKRSIRDLVYEMITVSSNLATNLLIDFVSPEAVQRTIEGLGTRHMQVLRGVEDIKAFRQGLSNTTTAADLALLLDALRRGEAVSPAADREMIEILLDQRFNEMIPAGLPPDARIAHKTGSITAIHHDAALVYPAGGAPYVLVVLIEGIEASGTSAALGAEVARTVHAALR